MKICVLLSTYNGEKFLSEQLESIVAQQGCEVDVLVRDDGSSDNTSHILDEWQNQGKLKWYKGPNLGYAMSFLELVKTAGDYDYYAFCDQDDIWLPDKISVAIDCLTTLKAQVRLYCSNLSYYKDGENHGLIKQSFIKYDVCTSLVQNIATGCTMVFNKELKLLLSQNMPQYLIAHDFWVYQVAMIFGDVFYDGRSFIYYRQHSDNQIGANLSLYERWKRRINKVISRQEDGRTLQAKELLRCFDGKIDNDVESLITFFVSSKENFLTRIKLIFDCRYSMIKFSSNIIFRFRILFKSY